MTKRPFFVAVLTVLLSAAQSASARQYPQPSPTTDERENIPMPPPEDESSQPSSSPPGASSSAPRTVTESLPYTPYPAGLSWVLTPQPFRVRWINGWYYPLPHYVRRCPYYPRGYYWGANWQANILGRDKLIAGRRFNPYLTAAKAKNDPKLRGQRRYAMPPGPEGQAMLLGATPPPPATLMAKRTEPEAGDSEVQVAADDGAREEPATQPTSSRRTARKKERDLH